MLSWAVGRRGTTVMLADRFASRKGFGSCGFSRLPAVELAGAVFSIAPAGFLTYIHWHRLMANL
jgi:hypothetical protein